MKKLWNERRSGILLHPTSLPGKNYIGDLGPEAYRFVDFLRACGQTLWQVLPCGPTGYGDSPYSALSAFAGNPLMISPEILHRQGLLREDELPPEKAALIGKVDYARARTYNEQMLQQAYERFKMKKELHYAFGEFCHRQAHWLEKFVLYKALKEVHGEAEWTQWQPAYALAQEEALQKATHDLSDKMSFHRFVQYLFFDQWQALKAYGNQRGISFIGDMPIYVAWDSADTWGNRELFALNEEGYPQEVGGVPPDYFSETGQLWGNPVYDWDYQKSTGFQWWIRRFQHTFLLFDWVRVDHFRGFEAYWAVPYGEKTAIKGLWKKAPGDELFSALSSALGPEPLPIIAEDLGVITPEVVALREKFNFPGLKILQFAFDSKEENDFIPFRYERNYVVYTGTHDNDTTLGWFEQAAPQDQEYALRYMNSDRNKVVQDFIRLALSTVSHSTIFPMQDLLGLDSTARMNFPGTAEGNWNWRFQWDQLREEVILELADLTRLYGRWFGEQGGAFTAHTEENSHRH
ncbi:4-alpha-glucanotransferase [Heliorestis acidaminivorans]|uniref:4-alpha-glucanotransferase n=1 Tax=Heliorestis acidaminivorans TaxID=553427 RepID=A0A6I0EPZ9_9FIRM|nr:4-alpha-glucanotransferase [Heliorestis acidaminivorans]KAB2952087.1 4-alpha-glucanotransferase [Heliorestis acidaminivorans]